MSIEAGEGRRSNFLGLDMLIGPVDVLARAVMALPHDRFNYVVTPNADHVVRLARESVEGALHEAYRGADLRLLDSKVLALLGKLCGERLQGVTGTDITAEVFARYLRDEHQVLIVGGDSETLPFLRRRFPRPRYAQHVPPMGLDHDPAAQDALVDAVENANADIIIFAIGSPRSELLCARIAKSGRARGTALCTGAAIEFITGRKPRAPAWMQRFALEWLHRLLSEPRRLARRYLIEGPAIFRIVLNWRRTGKLS